MARYQVQRADRNGEWEDIHQADYESMKEAKKWADIWSCKNPKCAWGVRVVDTLDDNFVIWED